MTQMQRAQAAARRPGDPGPTTAQRQHASLVAELTQARRDWEDDMCTRGTALMISENAPAEDYEGVSTAEMQRMLRDRAAALYGAHHHTAVLESAVHSASDRHRVLVEHLRAEIDALKVQVEEHGQGKKNKGKQRATEPESMDVDDE